MSPLSEPEMPLVSVVIPTYNRPAYLRQAIASVLQQTYSNFEIIVSDDCSEESPQAIVESFQDPRVRFRRNQENLGIGWNATLAFGEAKGRYVASLNDDDWWHEDFLEKMVAPLEADTNLVLSFCDHYITNAEGVVDQAETEIQSGRWKRDQLQSGAYPSFWKMGLIDQSVYTASAAIIRKDRIDWNQLHQAGVFWDYFIVYLACKSGGGAYYIPDRLAYYRVHSKSETIMSGKGGDIQAKIRKGKAAVFCHECFLQEAHLQDYRNYFEKEWAHSTTTLGIGLLRANQVNEARQYLWRSLRHQTFSLRTLAALGLSFAPAALIKLL
jgi:glycosyltransferase involved in cell wall biosynthesis